MPALAGYLALGTIDPVTGQFAETAYTNYARQAVSFDFDLPQRGGAIGTGGNVLRTTADVTFPAPAALDWPPANAFGLFADASGGAVLVAWSAGRHGGSHPRGRARLISAGRLQLTESDGRLLSDLGPVLVPSGLVSIVDGLLVIGGAGGSVGIAPVVASRALGPEDNGKILRIDAATPVAITVPGSLPVGFSVGLARWGAGAVTIAAAGGAQNRSGTTAISKQYGFVSIAILQNVGGAAAEFLLGGDAA